MTDQVFPWKANEEFMEALMSMGISAAAAENALFCTDNQSLEAAASYAFDNLEDEEDEYPDLELAQGGQVKSVSTDDDDTFKMVFVVNTSLEMGTGKVAAQVAHACLGLYRNMNESRDYVKMLNKWEHEGEKKIVLKGKDHVHLNELQKRASEMSVQSCLICDAGRTQIPSGSVTCLSLFGEEKQVNVITGDLKLL